MHPQSKPSHRHIHTHTHTHTVFTSHGHWLTSNMARPRIGFRMHLPRQVCSAIHILACVVTRGHELRDQICDTHTHMHTCGVISV